MNQFEKHKEMLNQELDKFAMMLSEILPRYLDLMKKSNITTEETKELGDLEHFLIEINAKIADIKNRLDHDLFGETIEEYYKIKEKAKKGDLEAKAKYDKLKEVLSESIKGNTFFNWN